MSQLPAGLVDHRCPGRDHADARTLLGDRDLPPEPLRLRDVVRVHPRRVFGLRFGEACAQGRDEPSRGRRRTRTRASEPVEDSRGSCRSSRRRRRSARNPSVFAREHAVDRLPEEALAVADGEHHGDAGARHSTQAALSPQLAPARSDLDRLEPAASSSPRSRASSYSRRRGRSPNHGTQVPASAARASADSPPERGSGLGGPELGDDASQQLHSRIEVLDDVRETTTSKWLRRPCPRHSPRRS